MRIIKNIRHGFFKKKELQNIDLVSSFFSLSPTDQIENGQHYFDALNWALYYRKEKNIKNIAFTGPYGSGKSSILQSFQKVNTDRNLHFLNISLATFKEGKKNDDKTKGEELQRLIELSILQQLFYREKDQKLPDSRLKKITNFSWKKLLLLTLVCFLFLISFVYLINSQFVAKILKWNNISDNLIIHWVFVALCMVGIAFAIYKSIRILHNLKISKLNINNAEIAISPEINKSVLNHNLEEILYFFEVTPYNVVVIEDLDRFQETEIFTKLREINLLINNSKKINRSVVFIYAIRDDMFADKYRTKFFDFIIPIIPVINSSNSNEKLREAIQKIADNVSENLIENISLFIDEMRVLYNIVNEFKIYKQILSDKLNPDKLLAMIVYKNICPCDFVKLSNYEGDLYDTIKNKKHEYIKEQSEIIGKEIAEYKEEIKKLEVLKIKDIKELRALYILQYVKLLSRNNTHGITGFHINNQDYNFDEVLDDNIFPYFTEDNVTYCSNQYYSSQSISHKFSYIEKQVDTEYTYVQREQQINDWNNDKIQELKQKVTALEQTQHNLGREKISKLLSYKNVSVELKDNKQKLINTLLRNGYIAEDYLDYISLFHEGSLSKNDFTFLLNVKSQINTDLDHNLDHIENLIKKIHIDDFSNEYILNYKLIDFVLTNSGYEKQKDAIFSILKNETEKTTIFIDGYVDNGIGINLFIKELYRYHINVYDFMYRGRGISGIIPEKKLTQYFKLIIENADIADIKATAENSFLTAEITYNRNNNFNIFNLISDEAKIKDVLKIFSIKFSRSINPLDMSEAMLDYIYQNNHYIIRADLLQIMMQAKGSFNQVDFDTRNYYAIKNSNCDALIKYVEDNINDYITAIYLKLEANTKEDENCLIELLNNDKIIEKDKTAIIQKVETKISDLSKIDLLDIENTLLQNSKVKPTWANLIENFVNAENEMSEFVVEFLNNKENAEILSKSKINKEPNEDVTKKLSRAIILNEKISNEHYTLLLKSVPYYYTSLEFENLSEAKVQLLIENNTLGLNEDNHTKLRKNFDGLHIKLIEKRHHELSETLLEELSFDNDDIISILKSNIIPKAKKQLVFDSYDEDEITESIELFDQIGEKVLDSSLNINKKVLMSIITKSNNTNLKIDLFNKLTEMFEKEDIPTLLEHLPEPYCSIGVLGSSPFLEGTERNYQFAYHLQGKNFISSYKKDKKGKKNKELGVRIATFKN